MKKNMKALEEKTSMYMQQILDLEEELRKMSSVKVQLKTYKQRVCPFIPFVLCTYVCIFCVCMCMCV